EGAIGEARVATDGVGHHQGPVRVVVFGRRDAVVGIGDGRHLRGRGIGLLLRDPGSHRGAVVQARTGRVKAFGGVVLLGAVDLVVDGLAGRVQRRGGGTVVVVVLELVAVGIVRRDRDFLA